MDKTTTWLAGVTLEGVPPAWYDRSMLALAAPTVVGDSVPANITIARDARDGPQDDRSEALSAYVSRQHRVLAQQLPGFNAMREGLLREGEFPVQELLMNWRNGAETLTQWLVWFDMRDGSMVCFTATARSAEFEQHRETFENMVRKLKIDPRQFPRHSWQRDL